MYKSSHMLFPLDLFYNAEERPLPRPEPVSGEDVPEPQHSLLVHNNDMTPTLEDFYGGNIELEVLRKRIQPERLQRLVVLRTAAGKPVLFGAIEINLNTVSGPASDDIVACRTPLGAILRKHRILHFSAPLHFFRIPADDYISTALSLDKGHVLFGRVNHLVDEKKQIIVRVVEILPPKQ